ncbi:MAG: DUF1579 family protein [Phycisphaerales bacterium]|nr:DUF1579 family protein [Phycisphaerales bacterium]
MNTRSLIAFGAGALAASTLAFLVASGPEHDEHKNTHQPDAMEEMGPAEMMAAMAEKAAPGEEHEQLMKTCGEWTAKSSFIMDPAAPPMESTGTMTIESVMGGRFVKCDFEMDFMGQPFNGLSYAGYDKYHNQYVSIWMDTMSTKITYLEGNHNEDGDLVMKGISSTPMGDNPMKIVTTHHDDDHFTDHFYDKMPDGTWFQSGTIKYTRK